jgi:hypothetical protein
MGLIRRAGRAPTISNAVEGQDCVDRLEFCSEPMMTEMAAGSGGV